MSKSSFNMHLASSGPSQIVVKSIAGLVFIGPSQNGDTRVESGFYLISVQRESALAVGETDGLPSEYALRQNYPNPFNPSTTLRFDLPQAAQVYLVVYDLLGREVARLADGRLEAGEHRVVWNGRDARGREVPTGLYIARMVTATYTKSIKLVLLK
ncbi:MAG: T9SS type A sorting domain-containing protein [Candidatus Marinimicrobia bacterium]|nr:T9SS type A sorting domain-containing protein [Candidatus Neomarinimicrobiota bacterium]